MNTLSATQERIHILNIQSQNTQSNESLGILVRYFHKQIYALVWKISPVMSCHDDLYQEGVLGLIESIHRFDLTKSTRLSTFSFNHIKGRMLNWLDSETTYLPMGIQAESDNEVVDNNDDLLEMCAPKNNKYMNNDHSDAMEREIDKSLIQRALALLPERQREVAILYYWHDYNHVEIARQFGISQPRVTAILSKGLNNLRKEVKIAA